MFLNLNVTLSKINLIVILEAFRVESCRRLVREDKTSVLRQADFMI